MEDFSIRALDASQRGLRLVGELDMASAPEVTEALASLDGDGQLTLDLSELTFIDSTGLHAILKHARSLNGAKLVLANPSSTARRIFEIVELEKHPSIEIQSDGSVR